MLAAAMLLGVAGRLAYGWHAPFWFDETFSGVIASQPDFGALLSWCLNEVTGPAYYMPLWAWEKVAGHGDTALRLPSLLCSLAAPALIAWKGHGDRDLRLFWAVLVLLWLPAQVVAFEARPYPQLFLLGVAQAIAFARLLERSGVASATWWTGWTALAVLTNYNALVIAGVQGVIYLAHHRKAALATWPALWPMLPVAAWTAVHLSFLLMLMGAHGDAYHALPLAALVSIPAVLVGLPLHGTLVLGTIAASGVLLWRRGARWQATPEALLALSGLLAVAVVLVLAFLRPGFAPRYLTPAMPALLFAVAWWARTMLRIEAKPVAIVVAVLMLAAGGVLRSSLSERDGDVRHLFNLERPSAWLAQRPPRRLAFLWDGPVGAASDPVRMAQVAGFFLHRDGVPVAVKVIRSMPGTDPNQAMLAAARHPDRAILWIANDRLGGAHVPRLDRIDPRRECRDFGEGQVVVTACRQRGR